MKKTIFVSMVLLLMVISFVAYSLKTRPSVAASNPLVRWEYKVYSPMELPHYGKAAKETTDGKLSMEIFEKTYAEALNKDLNMLGLEGWELVPDTKLYIFKRRL